jgi:hypothetical protein
MIRRISLPLLVLVLFGAQSMPAWAEEVDGASPAFKTVPELSTGFHLLYSQKFSEARDKFENWNSHNPEEPFGQVAIAASYLFEELYRQDVLSSDFFLNEKRFLGGIEGKPDPARMKCFQEAIEHGRRLARQRLEQNPKDPEAIFALTLAAGMESNASMILKKQHLESLKRLKEANEYAKQLLAEHPEAKDAYVALGSANYIIGSLSGGQRFFLWFGGIHGDKKLGMQQLQKTVDGGRYLIPFAKILLALSARREKQNALAQKLLLELSEEFPDGTIYSTEYAKATGKLNPAEMKAQ